MDAFGAPAMQRGMFLGMFRANFGVSHRIQFVATYDIGWFAARALEDPERYAGRVAISLVWVTNTWGFVDLLNGVRGVLQLNVPSFNLATFWYVYTFYAPLVIVSHVMIFGTLLKSRYWKK